MKYPKEYLDEIKLRLKVSQVVGKSVQLKKEAKNLLVFLLLKMKKAHHLQLMMRKNFIIALVLVNTEIFLIF
jgi:DNA primase